MKPVGVGVVGMGFMGRTHALNAARLGKQLGSCRLVAVCSPGVDTSDDLLKEDRSGNLPGMGEWPPDCRPRVASSYADLLADDNVDLVVVCTPTPLHVPMSVDALNAGKHVFVEKPVALCEEAMAPLIARSGELPQLLCMPAHVMRFWPGWVELAGWVRDGRYGRVLSATFQRLGAAPGWNRSFYADHAVSGGALVDLHVHDVDFIVHCFGEPGRVMATGDAAHVTGCYLFEDGPAHVTAEASWGRQPGAEFCMRFCVEFECATAEFESGRDLPLRVTEGDGAMRSVGSPGEGYAAELAALVRAIAQGTAAPVELADAAAAARVIDRERACLRYQREEPR